MKMTYSAIESPFDGTVSAFFEPGELVSDGSLLVEVTATETEKSEA